MNGEQIVTRTREAKTGFGAKCSKFSGAVTVELLKMALAEEFIPTSGRDVFVRGIPLEIDLLVPRSGEEPLFGLLYEPWQVAAALEVKNMGSFGESTLKKIEQNFNRFREAGIPYAYVTFEERRSFRWAASTERLSFPCFTLAWHKVTAGAIEPTEDWGGLVKFLRQCVGK